MYERMVFIEYIVFNPTETNTERVAGHGLICYLYQLLKVIKTYLW